MKLERIETPGIAHYAYVLADRGEAAVIDPRRDVDDYLAAARRLGARIRWVVETHRQEDFVMGAAHLAQLTGARVVNGTGDTFGHGDLRLRDGDTFPLGGLTIRALHTPGHTPESASYAVYTDASQPWCVFTGDALFFGTTGRTDLADPARAAENAARLYDAVHEKLGSLPDGTLVFPAHGAGSVCGSGMAERPFSTIGDEKRYNEVFTLGRDAFARRKGGERLPRPPYFRRMEQVNLQGGMPPARPTDAPPLLDADRFAEASAGSTVYDTREPEAFAGGHLPGSLSIWLGGLPVFGGWMADEHTPILLLTDRDGDVDVAAQHLARIGIDRVQGALAGGFGAWRKSGQPIEASGVITPRLLAEQRATFQVLDVRDDDEFGSGYIPGAEHVYVGYLRDRLNGLRIDPQRPVAVTCGVGHRAGIAVSVLLRAGFTDVRNLLGGMTAWKNLGLPLER